MNRCIEDAEIGSDFRRVERVRLSFRRRIRSAAWLGLFLFAGWAGAAERVSLQLSWLPQFQFAGYYVAQERGYFRDAGLVVEIRSGGAGAAPVIESVTSGRADFGIANSGIAVARMNGKPVRALAAVLQQPAAVWLMRGDRSPLLDLAKLARGRVMWAGPIEDSIELLQPLAQAGVPPSEVRAVPRSYAIEAFGSGQVDLYAAYSTSEMLELTRRGLPYHVVPSGLPNGPRFYGEVLFTSDALASAHPDVVARFLEASLKGWAEAFADIDGTARMIHARYAPQQDLAALMAEGRRMHELSQPEDVELGHMSEARWRAIAASQHGLGFGKDARAVDALVWPSRPVSRVGPDPVRLTLVGLVLALCFSLWRLWRLNRNLAAALKQSQQLQGRAMAEELRFHFLMDVAPFPVLMFALDDGAVVYANERALGWLGVPDGISGAPVQTWLPALQPDAPILQRLHSRRILRDIELELPGSAGASSRWCLLTVRAIEYEGRPCAFAAGTDITVRKEAELQLSLLNAQRGRIIDEVEHLQAKLRDTSLRDPLTGLFNRRYLDATLSRELARCQREGQPLTVLVIDADHFKRVNDSYGHAAGDDVLRAIAQVLQSTLRTEDVVCRYGGEEFVAVLPGADLVLAAARGEALRVRIEALQIATESGLVQITVSIGAALAQVGDTPVSAFKRADEAVYRAKQTGRNRVVCAGDAGAAGAALPAPAVAG